MSFCAGGIRTTLHSNDRAVRATITAYQSGTCTTLDRFSSVRLNFLSSNPVRHNFVRGVVYVPLCIQMIEQSELQSLHINVVHVPL